MEVNEEIRDGYLYSCPKKGFHTPAACFLPEVSNSTYIYRKQLRRVPTRHFSELFCVQKKQEYP